MGQYGFVININDCYGCKTCSVACKSENLTAKGITWRKVREFRVENPNRMDFISMSCNHCDDPQCMKVCPVSAYTKRDDGIVLQDHEKCLGCRSCVMACPYSAPQYDPVEQKVSKCDMCVERIDQGLIPRCVESCPAQIIKFGEINELRAEYGNDIEVVESMYNMPSHKISQPNVVIIAAN
ncbi:4Fe-4S ferredoxin [Robertmurraya siralis]|uniref:4Fe-4S ferredoxin n=1 Tax=Robertmurraya siralis TaxID=77777 RepID=A0A920BUC6_9BACI|nr:4Fe-4S dicluster domain-containing protein [Robertmurraya siralis]PAE20434.1 4Fe-4S ferredoxin [Bacillus sp. 7504-2]GIN62466.1 4Fe-4S ferredoxin [Robertmurraya siralis]